MTPTIDFLFYIRDIKAESEMSTIRLSSAYSMGR